MLAVIIPDRNDRPAFTDHAIFQINRQTRPPDQIVHVDYWPVNMRFDLSERIQAGLKECHCDRIAIWENDDYYPDNYLERVDAELDRVDIVGFDFTIYYHLKFLTYTYLMHFSPPRSTFAFTAFRREAINGFRFPDNRNPLVDMELWKFANMVGLKMYLFNPEHSEEVGFMPVSMKHGIGLCGVRWHYRMMPNSIPDPAMEWLKAHTRTESFDFYTQWHTKNR